MANFKHPAIPDPSDWCITGIILPPINALLNVLIAIFAQPINNFNGF